MTKGVAGYGRYDDDPGHIGCPRAKSDMTPCIARDGHTALADDDGCVGCGTKPTPLLYELRDAGVTPSAEITHRAAQNTADLLCDMVRQITEDVPGTVPGGERE